MAHQRTLIIMLQSVALININFRNLNRLLVFKSPKMYSVGEHLYQMYLTHKFSVDSSNMTGLLGNSLWVTTGLGHLTW